MGRFRPSGSTGHHIQYLFPDCYRLSWVVDRYYAGSRLRYPTSYTRETDTAGAKRFARKWGVKMSLGRGDA